MTVLLKRGVAVGAAGWAGMLVLAPFLATRAHAAAWQTIAVVTAYGAGSLICHQLPLRSFHLWGAQMPVCARCAGIYIGGALAAIAFTPRAAMSMLARARPVSARRAVLVLAVLPTAATLLYEWTTGAAPSNAVRFAAGVPIGVAAAWLIVSAAADQVN